MEQYFSRRALSKSLAALPLWLLSTTAVHAAAEVSDTPRADEQWAVKALTFDTGGTILDWHSGIRDALAEAGARSAVKRDWSAVANEYRRAIFAQLTKTVRAGAAAIEIEAVHRDALDAVLMTQDLEGFTAEDRRAICGKWHTLNAWPDVAPALSRLRERFIVAPLTIFSVSLVVDTARRNRIAWDAVISCEMIGAYKPKPEVYATAARWLGLKPAEIMMVAAHNFDLDAARAVGFRTAFVRRPSEWGPAGAPDPEPHPGVDIKAADFTDLARQLGAL
jgi:2-haloacid dehalogenase